MVGLKVHFKRQILVAATIILVSVSGCQKPKGFPKLGSCFGAVTGAMGALRTYMNDKGSLPFVDGKPMQALREAGVQEEDLQLVVYVNDKNIAPSSSSPRTVILICQMTQAPDNGKYLALLSGDIMYVPAEAAHLGMPLGDNVGRKVDHR